MNEVLRDIKHIIDKAEPCDIDPLSVKTFEEQKERLKAVKDYPIEPKWIPCEERLPKEHGMYLTTHLRGHITIERYGVHHDGDRHMIGWGDTDLGEWPNYTHHHPMNKVIAWMPLPPSYKGERP